jgi:NitT/TauT family transport system permease protein
VTSADTAELRSQRTFEAEEARQPSRGRTRARAVLLPIGALASVVVVWEAWVRIAGIPSYLLPAPLEILARIGQDAPLLWRHTLVTLSEILGGFALSVAIGIPLAVGVASSRIFGQTVYPIIVAAQSIPKVAIAPLIIVWFGFDWKPKIIVAFLIAFFPIVIDTIAGLRSTPIEMRQLGLSMGANAWQRFALFRFPNALPHIFSGLKVAITLATVGSIVAEFVGADQGLGYLMQIGIGQLDTVLLFAAVFVLSVLGILLFLAVDIAERLLLPWHVANRAE